MNEASSGLAPVIVIHGVFRIVDGLARVILINTRRIISRLMARGTGAMGALLCTRLRFLLLRQMKAADGILLGSPVHFSAIGGTMKSFLDRAFYVNGVNGNLLRHKVGAAVVAVRRSGGLPAFNQLNNFLCYSEMLLPTSNYWNVIHGTRPGEATKDEEGRQIMQVLGRNMAWLMQLVQHGRDAVPAPARENKIYMNFIR